MEEKNHHNYTIKIYFKLFKHITTIVNYINTYFKSIINYNHGNQKKIFVLNYFTAWASGF